MAKRNSEGEGLDKQIPEDGWNRGQIVIVGKYTTTEWLSSPIHILNQNGMIGSTSVSSPTEKEPAAIKLATIPKNDLRVCTFNRRKIFFDFELYSVGLC